MDRIYTRLGINSRAALVRYASKAGLLPHTPELVIRAVFQRFVTNIT